MGGKSLRGDMCANPIAGKPSRTKRVGRSRGLRKGLRDSKGDLAANASEMTNSFEFLLHGYPFMEAKESSGST
jgi:hypothetical protein